jgi:hypothetical protein
LCDSLGLHFPWDVRKSQLLITEAVSPTIRGFISFNNGYIRQAIDGNLHLGVRGLPIDVLEKSSTYSAFIDAGRFFSKIFPFIRNIHIIRGFAGFTTWTPDGIPIIDKAPGLDGFYLAASFSGHGFCLGPAVGELLAEWICDGSSSLDLSGFSWTRFEDLGNRCCLRCFGRKDCLSKASFISSLCSRTGGFSIRAIVLSRPMEKTGSRRLPYVNWTMTGNPLPRPRRSLKPTLWASALVFCPVRDFPGFAAVGIVSTARWAVQGLKVV